MAPQNAVAWGKVIMYYVYILKLNNKDLYTGFTDNLKRRTEEHSCGKVKTTSKNLPVRLVWYCSFFGKNKALEFEKYLKSSSGFAFRNKSFWKIFEIMLELFRELYLQS